MNAAPPRIPRRPIRTARGARGASRRKPLLWAVLFIVVLVAGAWGVFLSPAFRTSQVHILGLEGDVLESVSAAVAERVLDQNLVLLDIDELSGILQSDYPQLRVVSVVRVWPHTIEVELEERVSLGTWCRATEPGRPCYYFDDTGAIWGEAIPSSGTLRLTVIDERPEGDLQVGLLNDLIVISEGLGSLDVAIKQVVVREGPLRVLVFQSVDGYEVRFSRISSLSEQLDVLGAFLADRRSRDDVPALYMDVTVPGKVYFQ